MAHPQTLHFNRKLYRYAKGPIPEGAVERSETGGVSSGVHPFRLAAARQSTFPKGTAFGGGDKVSDAAQRRPLGGAGERSETEGVGWASRTTCISRYPVILNLHTVQLLVAKLLPFIGKYCILITFSASITCQNVRIFEKKHLSLQTRKRGFYR